MRKVRIPTIGKINKNDSYEGQSIETMIAKRMTGSDVEIGGKALMYTDRKDGVLPETNIRTDRFEIAQNALDIVERNRIARREAFYKEQSEKGKADMKIEPGGKGVGKTESTQGTSNL